MTAESGAPYRYEDIAGMVDHSLLAPTLDSEAFEEGLRLARDYGVASVCIVPHYVARAAEALAGSGVRATTVVGFPHGANATKLKILEAEAALADGAEELDMVVNVSRVLSADWEYVAREIRAVVELTHASPPPGTSQRRSGKLKVIFENCYLSDAHKIRLCEISGTLGVDWVKTSTGFGTGGATLADVELMRAHSPSGVQVKAAGGIRTLDELLAMRPFVTRVGLSRTREILNDCRSRLGLPAISSTETAPGDY